MEPLIVIAVFLLGESVGSLFTQLQLRRRVQNGGVSMLDSRGGNQMPEPSHVFEILLEATYRLEQLRVLKFDPRCTNSERQALQKTITELKQIIKSNVS